MNFHRSEPTAPPQGVAVVDDQVPSSGWMSIDLSRVLAGAIPPAASFAKAAPQALAAAAQPAPQAPASGHGAISQDAGEPTIAHSGEVSERIEEPPAETRKREWPKRGTASSRREPAEPYIPREPLRRVPDRDLIVVRAASMSARPTPQEPEPVLDLAEAATLVRRPARARRWWIVALLTSIMIGGLAYSFTRFGEASVISIPDTGRKDSVVT